MNIVLAFALVALGIGIDAIYQHKIRVAECDAYETGYQQGLKENTIHKQITVPEVKGYPSMAAPVKMPDTVAEKLKKHGRAMWRVE